MLSIGTLFNQHYRVQRCIRAGGMGAVYEVLDERTQRRRALKVMLPSLTTDPDLRNRFSLEITVAANVDSEHIVEVLDAGIDIETSAPFYVMELLKGEDLATAIERGPFSVEQTYVLLQQLSFALDRTHAQGIVHRDLKPGNLFLTLRDDGSVRLKILDFGIAKVTTQASQDAKTTRSIGTPLYMSPEQVMGDGRIGPASDRYALAQLAYTMLVGEAYFERDHHQGTVYQVLMRVVAGTSEPASERARARNISLPKAFDDWFAKATHRDPSQRYASSMDMLRAFADAFGLEFAVERSVRLSESGVQSSPPISYAEMATTQRLVVTPTSVIDAPLPLARKTNRTRSFIGIALATVVLGTALTFWLRPKSEPAAEASSMKPQTDTAKTAQAASVEGHPKHNTAPDNALEVSPTTPILPISAASASTTAQPADKPNRVVGTVRRTSARSAKSAASAASASQVPSVRPSASIKPPSRPPGFDPTDIR